jgi:hypothetical protein
MSVPKSARVQFCAISGPAGTVRTTAAGASCLVRGGALGGTRTPNLLIRSQMLYPLSYERSPCSISVLASWLRRFRPSVPRAQRD